MDTAGRGSALARVRVADSEMSVSRTCYTFVQNKMVGNFHLPEINFCRLGRPLKFAIKNRRVPYKERPLPDHASLYQRPCKLICAQARVVMESVALGSLARMFQALQQAATMSS